MAVYQYEALDTSGKRVSGIIDADAIDEARRKLRGLGIYPTSVTEGRPVSGVSLLPRRGRPSSKQVAVFTRNLATMVGAGFPIVDALSSIADQVEDLALEEMVTDIREKVKEGSPLSEALSLHPDCFGDMFVAMVRAGEKSGQLEDVLLSLSESLDKRAALKNRIASAMAYPILMLSFALAMVCFLFTYAVPQMAELFSKATGGVLPWPTRVVMGVSDAFLAWWWAMILAVVVVVAAFQHHINTENGRKWWDGWKLRTWVLGPLNVRIAISRFVRTLGTLLDNGVPILQSLEIVQRVVDNVILSEAIAETRKAVSQGANLATPLKQSGHFPAMVVDMIAAGQKSGQLEKMLLKLADDYDQEVESRISMLVSLIEPLIIISMGLVVGFIVLSVVLPIFEMNKNIQ